MTILRQPDFFFVAVFPWATCSAIKIVSSLCLSILLTRFISSLGTVEVSLPGKEYAVT